MGRRSWRVGFALALMTGGVGCGGGDRPAPSEPAESAAVDVVALARQADLDEVVTMEEGGFVPVPDATKRRTGIFGAHHVLRAQGPDGPIDLFEYRTRRIGAGEALWLCHQIVSQERTETPCTPQADDPPLIGPVFWVDRRSVFALDGPADTSHFVAVVDGRRIALVPVDSQALLVVVGSPCTLELTVEAWRDDTMLESAAFGAC